MDPLNYFLAGQKDAQVARQLDQQNQQHQWKADDRAKQDEFDTWIKGLGREPTVDEMWSRDPNMAIQMANKNTEKLKAKMEASGRLLNNVLKVAKKNPEQAQAAYDQAKAVLDSYFPGAAKEMPAAFDVNTITAYAGLAAQKDKVPQIGMRTDANGRLVPYAIQVNDEGDLEAEYGAPQGPSRPAGGDRGLTAGQTQENTRRDAKIRAARAKLEKLGQAGWNAATAKNKMSGGFETASGQALYDDYKVAREPMSDGSTWDWGQSSTSAPSAKPTKPMDTSSSVAVRFKADPQMRGYRLGNRQSNGKFPVLDAKGKQVGWYD